MVRLVRLPLRAMTWGLVAALLGGLALMQYLDRHVDEDIRSFIEQRISQCFPKLSVSLHAAQFSEGRGITLRGLQLRWADPDWPDGELATIEEIFLATPATLNQLLRGTIQIEQVTLHRPRLRLVRYPDGRWNLDQLHPHEAAADHGHIPLVVEHGLIELVDQLREAESSYILRDINLQLRAQPPAEPNPPATDGWHVEGHALGDHVHRIDFAGQLHLHPPAAFLRGTISSLDFSPELLADLPREFGQQFAMLASLRARASVEFRVDYRADAPTPLQFALAVNVTRGRWDDPRLPYPLTDLQATLAVDNARLHITQLTARSQNTTLQLQAVREGWGAEAPWRASVSARRLLVERQLFALLPEQYQSLWFKFVPQGEVDLDAQLQFDGQAWHPEATVRCLDVSFAYYRLPYRLDRARGVLSLRAGGVDFDLQAFARADPVHIRGHIENPGPEFTGYVTVEAPRLRLDEDMLSALHEQHQRMVRSLRPAGEFALAFRLQRDEPRQAPRRHLRLDVLQGYGAFELFPYPLSGVRGTVEMIDDHWMFHDVQASNGAAHVVLRGSMTPLHSGGELQLEIAAAGVPLNAELAAALPLATRRAWDELRPRGALDVHCSVRYVAARRHMDLTVRLQPHDDSLSIEPRSFPYRLERLQGTATYHAGRLTLTRLRGEHGRTTFLCDGVCELLEGAAWRLDLQRLYVDRLAVDRDLLPAVPPALRQALTRLRCEGHLNLSGRIVLEHSGMPAAPLNAAWDVQLHLHNHRISPGITLEGIYGQVRLQGQYRDGQLDCHGELALDAVRYGRLQATDVRGPLWMDNDRLFLGAPRESQMQPGVLPHITARCYGGTAYLDAWVLDGTPAQYSLRARVMGADLARFAREVVGGQERVSGIVHAGLNLSGAGEGTHALRGDGYVQLREADIYQLPLMVALLKVVSLQPPGKTAFTSSDIDYRIEGENIYFDRINFLGDAISLLGRGEMNFDRHIRLTFRSVVGRSDRRLPLVSDVLGGATQQLLQITAEGPLHAPHIRTETLPDVTEALQQFQAELERGPLRLGEPRSAPVLRQR
jgi:hypothetical protein